MPIKLLIFIVITSFISSKALAQVFPKEYHFYIKAADSFYKIKEYKNSAFQYSEAFKTIGWKAYPNDRFNAACSWALSGIIDSAFYQLEILANKSQYTSYGRLASDPDFYALHTDKRWDAILAKVQQNNYISIPEKYRFLLPKLDSIYVNDQKPRKLSILLEKQYAWNSDAVKNINRLINKNDSINLIQVKSILNTYGWLGADEIGEEGNSVLFLVIQHSNLETQVEYLPMMRDAVKKGKAKARSLALLEDRILLGQGKKQIYGSQIGVVIETQEYYLAPLEDPDNVDKRRAEVGLGPLAQYLLNWGIVWDVEQYKKDLEGIERRYFRR